MRQATVSYLICILTSLKHGQTNWERFVSAKTDDGEELTLSPAVKEQWATRPDTTYRALLYYDRVEKGVTTSFALKVLSWFFVLI